MTTRTRGALRGEIRAVTDTGTFDVLAVAYNILDDYGTLFAPGVFNASLTDRLPVVAWAHNWDEPIGRATAWHETDQGLALACRLDIAGDVPRAKQALEQMRSGTLTDVSVGFWRLADETTPDGHTLITKGELDEVSVVLRGAVPGAKVLAVRSVRAAGLALDDVLEIARKKASGEIDEATADEALRLLATDDDEDGDPGPAGGGGSELDADLDEALAEADAALDQLTDRSAR